MLQKGGWLSNDGMAWIRGSECSEVYCGAILQELILCELSWCVRYCGRNIVWGRVDIKEQLSSGEARSL